MTKQVKDQCNKQVDLKELYDKALLNKKLSEYLNSKKKETPKKSESNQGVIDKAI